MNPLIRPIWEHLLHQSASINYSVLNKLFKLFPAVRICSSVQKLQNHDNEMVCTTQQVIIALNVPEVTKTTNTSVTSVDRRPLRSADCADDGHLNPSNHLLSWNLTIINFECITFVVVRFGTSASQSPEWLWYQPSGSTWNNIYPKPQKTGALLGLAALINFKVKLFVQLIPGTGSSDSL